jgi:hypothetical protein
MAAAAFAPELARLQHQLAGAQPVVKIQQKIQIPAAAVAENPRLGWVLVDEFLQ